MADARRARAAEAVSIGNARTRRTRGANIAGYGGRTESDSRGGLTDAALSENARSIGKSAPGTGLGGAGGGGGGSGDDITETTTQPGGGGGGGGSSGGGSSSAPAPAPTPAPSTPPDYGFDPIDTPVSSTSQRAAPIVREPVVISDGGVLGAKSGLSFSPVAGGGGKAGASKPGIASPSAPFGQAQNDLTRSYEGTTRGSSLAQQRTAANQLKAARAADAAGGAGKGGQSGGRGTQVAAAKAAAAKAGAKAADKAKGAGKGGQSGGRGKQVAAAKATAAKASAKAADRAKGAGRGATAGRAAAIAKAKAAAPAAKVTTKAKKK